jgi:UDP-N-acetylmuramyl pentapeptide phosphotransferase/UDP-N-acetylglucosamine-1-phosphate transferase
VQGVPLGGPIEDAFADLARPHAVDRSFENDTSRPAAMPSAAVMIDAVSVARELVVLAPASILAGILTAVIIVIIWPWLERYALARPNARSSHRVPTPQGGGIAVVVATLAVAWAVIVVLPQLAQNAREQFLIVTAAALLLAMIGAIDDLRTLPAALRLVLQFIAVGAVLAAFPSDMQVLPFLPWWVGRACLLIGAVWWVNLVNFMDGIDWITVAEVVPMTAAIVVLGLFGAIGPLPSLVAAVLLGATAGFAPFNKPVARLFLGDVGSLPIGLLLGWLLLQLAGSGQLTAALILPLYYLADATITLVRRAGRGEAFWQAHRTHFYQRATDNGFTVREIVARVFLVNLGLAALALASVAAGSVVLSLLALAVSAVLVTWLLATFARARR